MASRFCLSSELFVDRMVVNEVHTIPQGEGGEQGDPLMPLLFCLGQHPALSRSVNPIGSGREALRIP